MGMARLFYPAALLVLLQLTAASAGVEPPVEELTLAADDECAAAKD